MRNHIRGLIQNGRYFNLQLVNRLNLQGLVDLIGFIQNQRTTLLEQFDGIFQNLQGDILRSIFMLIMFLFTRSSTIFDLIMNSFQMLQNTNIPDFLINRCSTTSRSFTAAITELLRLEPQVESNWLISFYTRHWWSN
jgi:hypothetical protein